MSVSKEEKPIEVIAHRGCSGTAPENTLAAIRAAIEVGADRVEFDVLLSLDGVPVLFHDPELDRTTDGEGPLRERTLKELRALDAGGWFAERFRGERIPALEEALQECRGRIAVNVEIKKEAVDRSARDPRGGVEEKVADALRRLGMAKEAVVSSFEPLALQRIRRMAKDIGLGSLYDREVHRGLGPVHVCAAVGSRAFNCSADEITAPWIEEAHGAGLRVNVYTVDDPESMASLIRLGVDGIFTNHPGRLLSLLNRGPASPCP